MQTGEKTYSRTMSKTFFAAVAALDSSGLDIFETSSSIIAFRGARLHMQESTKIFIVHWRKGLVLWRLSFRKNRTKRNVWTGGLETQRGDTFPRPWWRGCPSCLSNCQCYLWVMSAQIHESMSHARILNRSARPANNNKG